MTGRRNGFGRRVVWAGAVSALALAAGLSVGVAPGDAQQAPVRLVLSDEVRERAGSWTRGDRVLGSGAFADEYVVDARRGQEVAVLLMSTDADALLTVRGPGGFTQTNDDMDDESLDAMVAFTAPTDGQYRITATTFASGTTGDYVLLYGASAVAAPPLPPPPPERPVLPPPPPLPPPPQQQTLASSATAGTIQSGSSRSGTLAAGDRRLGSGEYFDTYTFQARAGDRFVIEMISGQFDPYVGVAGPGGFSEEIDDGGEGTNSRLAFAAPATGTYTITATSFRPGETGSYTLRLGPDAVPVRLPPPPPDRRDQTSGTPPGEVRVGQTVRGTLAGGDETLGSGEFADSWTLNGRRGERYEIRLSSTAFDPYLMVRGPGGLSADNDDDAAGQDGTNARLLITAAADGPITIGATSFRPGETGSYTLDVRRPASGAALPPPPPPPAAGIQVGGPPVRGTLAAGDTTLSSGEFADTYSVQLRRGQTVTAELDSTAFDAYLITYGPGDVRVDNDDGPGAGTNARATFTAAQDGVYFVRATSFRSGETGAYSLRLRAAPAADGGGAAPPPVQAGRLQPGQTVSGTLASSDPRTQGGQFVDRYTFQGRAGQRVVLDMASPGFDTVVTLVSPSGAREQNDDIASGNTNSRLDTTLATTGTYTVEASSFQTGTTGSYTLALATPAGETRPARPEPQPGAGEPRVVAGTPVTGRLQAGDGRLDDGQYLDGWTFAGRAGQTVTVDLESSDFDTRVVMVAPDGTGADNDDGPSGTNSRLIYTLPATGDYAIGVTSYAAGETGAYRLRVTEGSPQQLAARGGRVYGVFVGVSQYPDPADNLDDTDEDAVKLADTLRRNGILAPESVVLTNAQATRSAILAAVRRVGALAGPQDTFVVFYSGHGSKQRATGAGAPEPDGQDETLAVYDGSITDNEMADAFAAISARVSVLALDSCFSGGFARDVVSRPNVMGIFSSEEDLTSQVAAKFEAGGYLSHFLRLGLGGDADENRDRAVSAGELSAYLRRRFAEEGDIGAVTADQQRNYQYLVVERGGVKIDDILVFTQAGSTGGRG